MSGVSAAFLLRPAGYEGQAGRWVIGPARIATRSVAGGLSFVGYWMLIRQMGEDQAIWPFNWLTRSRYQFRPGGGDSSTKLNDAV